MLFCSTSSVPARTKHCKSTLHRRGEGGKTKTQMFLSTRPCLSRVLFILQYFLLPLHGELILYGSHSKHGPIGRRPVGRRPSGPLTIKLPGVFFHRRDVFAIRNKYEKMVRCFALEIDFVWLSQQTWPYRSPPCGAAAEWTVFANKNQRKSKARANHLVFCRDR